MGYCWCILCQKYKKVKSKTTDLFSGIWPKTHSNTGLKTMAPEVPKRLTRFQVFYLPAELYYVHEPQPKVFTTTEKTSKHQQVSILYSFAQKCIKLISSSTSSTYICWEIENPLTGFRNSTMTMEMTHSVPMQMEKSKLKRHKSKRIRCNETNLWQNAKKKNGYTASKNHSWSVTPSSLMQPIE